ncbi:MAG: DUF2791 family P-loop domain-containing protein [Candidatus Margulisbacteria bacterium]|nr:DUF2791 family P-loop domain-containing protein [Candidatus Margulisiibacteriota bacterium]
MPKIIADRYRLDEKLGSGSSGEVYKAWDQKEGKSVAVKLFFGAGRGRGLTGTESSSLGDFLRETRVLSTLSHPNLVRIFDAGKDDGTGYLVEELVDGQKLTDWIKEQGSFNETIQLIEQAVHGLAYIHEQGILHRDLKPANILVSREKPWTVKILDFGVAGILDIGKVPEPSLAGTIGYMSPEQLGLVQQPVDKRSDLYSLGVTLYEGLAGVLPFRAKRVEDLLHQQIAKMPDPIRSHNPKVPKSLNDIVFKLLNKDTEQRYQLESGLLADLDYCLHLLEQNKIDEEFVLGSKDRSDELSGHVGFIGRKNEMTVLTEQLDEIRSGIQKVYIVGDVGCGKTRLLEELKRHVKETGYIVLESSNSIYSKSIAYGTVSQLLDSFLQYVKKLDPKESQEWKQAIQQSMGNLGGVLTSVDPQLERFLGKQPEVVELAVAKEKFKFLNAMSNFLLGISSRRPAVVFLDDWQWIDESSIKLVEGLLQKLGGAPIMFILSGREDLHFERADVQIKTLRLGNLSHNEMDQMTSRLLKRDVDDVKLLSDRLYTLCSGNPYFFFEAVKYLAAKGVVYFRDNAWQFDVLKVQTTTVPDSLLELLLARLGQVKKESVDILKAACIWGNDFNLRVLCDIFGFTEEDVANALQEGISASVIRLEDADRKTYSFAHDKIAEVLYSRLTQTEQQHWHLKAGEYLEKRPHKEKYVAQLARHFIAAGQKEKAKEYSLMAASRAKKQYANAEAAFFYDTVLGYMGGDFSAERIAVSEELADVYALLGDFTKATSLYEEIVSRLSERLRKARIERKLGRLYFESGYYFESVDHYEKGLICLGKKPAVSKHAVLRQLLSQALVQMAHTFFPKLVRQRVGGNREEALEIGWIYAGLQETCYFIDMEKSLASHLKSMNLAERLREPKLLSHVYAQHGPLLCNIGMKKRALKYELKSLQIRKKIGDEWGIWESVCYLGLVYFYMLDYDNALKRLFEATHRMIEIGDFFIASICFVHIGSIYGELGEIHLALHYLEEGSELAKRMDDYRGLGMQQMMSVLRYISLGDYNRAIETGEKAIANLDRVKDYFLLSMTYYTLGRAYTMKGSFKEAFERYETSIYYIEQKIKIKGIYSIGTYAFLAETYLAARERMKDITHEQRDEFLRLAEKNLKIAMSVALKRKGIYLPMVYYVKGELEVAKGNGERAIEYLVKAIEYAAAHKCRLTEALACYFLGSYLQKLDDENSRKRSWEYLKRALSLFSDMRANHYYDATKKLLGESPEDLSAKEALKEKLELSSFFKVSQAISSILDMEKVLEKVMDSIIQVMGAQRGYLFLYGPGTNELEVRVARNLDKASVNNEDFEFSRNVIHHVDRSGESVVVTDAQSDERFRTKQSITTHKLKSILCVPLQYMEKKVGVIYLDNKLVTKLFTQDHLKLLNALATQAAIAIENARAYKEIEDLKASLEQKVYDRTRTLRMKSDQLELSHQELLKASRAKSEFISNMTHELRTPLSAVISFADLLRSGSYGDIPGEAAGTMSKVQGAARHLLTIINDLLDMAKIEAGKMKVVPEEFVIKDCIDTVLATVSPLADQKNIKLEKEITVNTAYGDIKRITQVLWNLLSNAIKFTDKGSIKVKAFEHEGLCEIAVKDTGIGIPGDKQEKVFALFEQVDPKHKGTGLGMTISKQLVELHGGKIWFESEVGQGTTFHFTLPYPGS